MQNSDRKRKTINKTGWPSEEVARQEVKDRARREAIYGTGWLTKGEEVEER